MKNKNDATRRTGYYWVKNRSGVWMIAKWWKSLQYWDFMRTLENDVRQPFPVEVDEKRIVRDEPIIEKPIKRRRRNK